MLTSLSYLASLEDELAQKISKVELIGELKLSAELDTRLGERIAQFVKNRNFTDATTLLGRRYPTCLVVYLVTRGIYGYNGGDYWTSIRNQIGISSNLTTQWGQIFEDFIRTKHLAFPPQEGASRYVRSILLHGGIPDYCLPDFFEKILYPAISRPELNGVTAEYLIQDHLSANSQNVDKPVTRFLREGGKIAIDFVNRCLEMAQSYEFEDAIPQADVLGLPLRVIEGYQKWVEKRGKGSLKYGSKLKLQSPQLVLDPYGDGVFIELPLQELTPEFQFATGHWLIENAEKTTPYPFHLNRNCLIDPERIYLENPTKDSRVTFQIDDRLNRTWHFKGIDTDTSLLAFDAETGNLINWRFNLPAKLLWLIYPALQPISIEGGQKRETFSQLPGEWFNYKIEEWDLTSAKLIKIGEKYISLEPDLTKLRPQLKGAVLEGYFPQPGEANVYLDLPDVIIPLSPQRTVASEAFRWNIRIINKEREQVAAHSVANLHYQDEGNHIRFSLGLKELLGVDNFGSYTVFMRGPLGRDITFNISLVPQLKIIGIENTRIPDQYGKLEAVELLIKTATTLMLTSLDSKLRIEQLQPGSFKVEVPSDRNKAELILQNPAKKQVTLSVPLPIIIWKLNSNKNIEAFTQDSPGLLSIPLETFLGVAEPRLLVTISPPPTHEHILSGHLRLNYDSDSLPQTIESRSSRNRYLSFKLEETFDSLRSSREGNLLFELTLDNLPGNTNGSYLPVLNLTRTIKLQNLTLSSSVVDEGWSVETSWQCNSGLKNRQLRLWPLWKPWKKPFEISIPDEKTNQFNIIIPQEELQPGLYRAEIGLKNPYSQLPIMRPLFNPAITPEVKIGSATSRANYLRNIPPGTESFLVQLLAEGAQAITPQRLKIFQGQYRQAHTPMLIETLLVLQEQPQITTTRNLELFEELSCCLLKFPAELFLYLIQKNADKILYSDWERYKKLLVHCSPPLLGLLNRLIEDRGLVKTEVTKYLKVDITAELEELGFQIWEEKIEECEYITFEELLSQLVDHQEYYENGATNYLRELAKNGIPKLRPEQEKLFIARAKNAVQIKKNSETTGLNEQYEKGEDALKQLALAKLPILLKIVKEYLKLRPRSPVDAISKGYIALMEALNQYLISGSGNLELYLEAQLRKEFLGSQHRGVSSGRKRY